MSAPALSLTNVVKRYGSVVALDGLSFDAAAGRFFALFGPSGVGKTTTLRAIAGLAEPDGGTIRIDGTDVTHSPIRGRGVAMVFQSFALYPHLTVADNFAYPLREAGVASAEIKKRAQETAEMLRLTHRLSNKPATLSGGEQQRVALGRALIGRPRILLLDEPLTNLDAKLRHDMRAELKRLHRQFGMTIIYATPDELEALSMGEEIGVMENGRIVQLGSPDALYEHPANIYVASKIGSPHMNLTPARVGADGRVEAEFGALAVPHKGLAPGTSLTLGLRPTDIDIADNGEPDISAVVHLVEPLGDVTLVQLETKGPTLRALFPEARTADVSVGDTLPLRIHGERAYLFNEADGTAIERAAA
ncbi:MAG: ABC transporter ATP-binding protein [Pseudomonadota bacterium]